MAENKFCAICRGCADDGPLQKCISCKRKFHIECINIRGIVENYCCNFCENSKENKVSGKIDLEMQKLLRRNKTFTSRLHYERQHFIQENRTDFLTFCSETKINSFNNKSLISSDVKEISIQEYESIVNIKQSPEYITNGTLRR
jgi:hypothetical protein